MTLEAVAAYSAAVASLVAIVGVAADHIWARRLLKKRDARNEYINSVADPITQLMLDMLDFRQDVSEWVEDGDNSPARDIQRAGARLNSKINFRLNEAAKSEHGGGQEWIELPTLPFENALYELSDEHRNLTGKTVRNELTRLTDALSRQKATNMPKA